MTGTHVVIDAAESGGAAGGELAGAYPNPTVASIAGATSITSAALVLTGAFSWTKATASPTVTHTAQTTDVACTNLTITSQAPYASATGANRNPGNLVLTVPAKASGGTAGKISMSVDGAEIASFSASLGTGVLHATSGQVVTSSTIVDADVSATAAIAGSKIAPDFAAQNVVTTGYASIGATPATTGTALRLAQGGTSYVRNAANNADLLLLSFASNKIDIGGSAASGVRLWSNGTVMVDCSVDQKLSFRGVAAISQPTAYTQTYATATRTHNNVTSSAVVTTAAALASYGFTQAQADSIPVAINAVAADLLNLKQLVNSLIDDGQSYGLLA